MMVEASEEDRAIKVPMKGLEQHICLLPVSLLSVVQAILGL